MQTIVGGMPIELWFEGPKVFTAKHNWLLDGKYKILNVGKETKRDQLYQQILTDKNGKSFIFQSINVNYPYYGQLLVQKCDRYWNIIQTFSFLTLDPFTQSSIQQSRAITMWKCSVCTLDNEDIKNKCDMCGNDRDNTTFDINNAIQSMDMTHYSEKRSRKRKQRDTDDVMEIERPQQKKRKYNENIKMDNNNDDIEYDDDEPICCPFCGFENDPHAFKCDKCKSKWTFN
eukprot:444495_1